MSNIEDFSSEFAESITANKDENSPAIIINEDKSVAAAVKIMTENNIGCVPVVNARNILVGIFSERDLIKRVISKERSTTETMVKSVMTLNPISASKNDSRDTIFKLMKDNHFRHIPIVDNNGVVITVYSFSDIKLTQDVILAVEDDSSTLDLIVRMLSNQGYVIRTATNGIDAKEFLANTPEDISAILMDWQMPGMNGIEVLKWVKSQKKLEHIPVILQTANTNPEQIRKGIGAGAYYYLKKPFNKNILCSIVNAAILDFRSKLGKVREIADTENIMSMLTSGKLRFQTLEEGEHLSVRIANATPHPDNAIMISELFINAIEHGNLGIGYNEKTTLIDSDEWLNVVRQRIQLPENANKYVELEVLHLNGNLIVYITDQGKGFDFKKYLKIDENRVFDNHGRGIAMAAMQMTVEYLGNGNKVKVTIPFST